MVWCLVVMMAHAPGLQANPLRNPKRLVDGRTVDLQPLFQWSTNHHGPRPLTGWVQVSGEIVGTNSLGWIIQARVEPSHEPAGQGSSAEVSSGGLQKIVLRHPPLADRTEFESLAKRLHDLLSQRDQASGVETKAKNQLKADEKQGGAHRRNRALVAEERELKKESKQAKDQVQALDRQITEVRAKMAAFGTSDHYSVDCFALKTPARLEQMAVFDHGVVFK